MGFIKEFKTFAMQGNLIDIAVGFVMGAAFTKLTSAFIDGMIMPLVSMLTGGVNFDDKKFILKEAVAEMKDASGVVSTPAAAEVAIKYGTFIGTFIEFLVVAFVMFMVVKAINKMKKKQEEAPSAGPSSTDVLLMEIRDALKK